VLTKEWISERERQGKNRSKFVHKLTGIVRMNEIRIERRIWKGDRKKEPLVEDG
jgi:hypothetical protein